MQECDLIMKGGITSGVVYPFALVEIAKEYRLRNIGGTSAGAIAAAFAAAAEYRRQEEGGAGLEGFDQLGDVAAELAEDMKGLFQPSPNLAPIFELLVSGVSEQAKTKGRPRALAGAALRIFRFKLAASAAAVMAVLIMAWLAGNGWLGAFGALLIAVALFVWIAHDLFRMLFVELPGHDFGLCSGLSQGKCRVPGFTEWIADWIDRIAGNFEADGSLGDPLTVGQLRSHGIQMAAMTTDLSSGRPYQLPLHTAIHFFSEAELREVFPARIVRYLVGDREPVDHCDEGVPRDLYALPVGDDFPVLLVARMSLSFPGLIRAVPLYRRDDQMRDADGKATIRRCLFSDGGISSNFPIHFFDALMPTRPTFGIALGSWEEARHGAERIDLPTLGRQSTNLPVRDIKTLGSFLSSILATAKDWQDTMQSMLTGYAERIVTIRLNDSREGGLNLAMDSDTIGALVGYGQQAGQALTARFSYAASDGFDQHRYNRAITLLPELESALVGFATGLDAVPAGAPPNTLSGRQVLTDLEPDHFRNSGRWRSGPFLSFANGLADLGRRAQHQQDDPGQKSVREGRNLPSVDTAIRLVALADRRPKAESNGDGE